MLQKLLQLAKDEGGKAFVMNETTGEIFCIMPLETYREMKRGVTVIEKTSTESVESVASLSEEELLRKINREIAIWRDNQKDKAEIILPSYAKATDGRPTKEDRAGVPSFASSYTKVSEDRKATDGRPEIKSHIAKDFPPAASIAKAPILETEEEFFLEMA